MDSFDDSVYARTWKPTKRSIFYFEIHKLVIDRQLESQWLHEIWFWFKGPNPLVSIGRKVKRRGVTMNVGHELIIQLCVHYIKIQLRFWTWGNPFSLFVLCTTCHHMIVRHFYVYYLAIFMRNEPCTHGKIIWKKRI